MCTWEKGEESFVVTCGDGIDLATCYVTIGRLIVIFIVCDWSLHFNSIYSTLLPLFNSYKIIRKQSCVWAIPVSCLLGETLGELKPDEAELLFLLRRALTSISTETSARMTVTSSELYHSKN